MRNDYLEASHAVLRQRAASSLRDLLENRPWSSFFTATFARPHKYPIGALSAVTHAIRQAGVGTAFIAAEQHESGLWHTHGLLYYSHPVVASRLIPLRLERLGWSNVARPNSQRLVSAYVSKYLTKDARMEYEFYGDWSVKQLPLDKFFER